MTICTMMKEGGSNSRYLKLELTEQGVSESTSNDFSFKLAKKKVHPNSLVSHDGLGYMGNLILGHIAAGWTLSKEDEVLSADRCFLTIQLDCPTKVALVTKLLLPCEARKLLSDERPVLQGNRLVTRASSSNGARVKFTTMFLRSRLDPLLATTLSAAAMFEPDAAATGNFKGEVFTSASMYRELRNFNLLDDALLDEIEAAGIIIRPVDFRPLAARTQAFVGF